MERVAISCFSGPSLFVRASGRLACWWDGIAADGDRSKVHVAALACERRTSAQAESLTVLAGRLTSWEDNLAFHCAIAAATQNFVLERLVRQLAELAGELHQREH